MNPLAWGRLGEMEAVGGGWGSLPTFYHPHTKTSEMGRGDGKAHRLMKKWFGRRTFQARSSSMHSTPNDPRSTKSPLKM